MRVTVKVLFQHLAMLLQRLLLTCICQTMPFLCCAQRNHQLQIIITNRKLRGFGLGKLKDMFGLLEQVH